MNVHAIDTDSSTTLHAIGMAVPGPGAKSTLRKARVPASAEGISDSPGPTMVTSEGSGSGETRGG